MCSPSAGRNSWSSAVSSIPRSTVPAPDRTLELVERIEWLNAGPAAADVAAFTANGNRKPRAAAGACDA